MYIIIHTHTHTHTHIPLLHSLITLGKLGSSEIPGAMSTPSIQILVSKYYSLLKRTRDLWKKKVITGLIQGKQNKKLKTSFTRYKEVAKESWGKKSKSGRISALK